MPHEPNHPSTHAPHGHPELRDTSASASVTTASAPAHTTARATLNLEALERCAGLGLELMALQRAVAAAATTIQSGEYDRAEMHQTLHQMGESAIRIEHTLNELAPHLRSLAAQPVDAPAPALAELAAHQASGTLSDAISNLSSTLEHLQIASQRSSSNHDNRTLQD